VITSTGKVVAFESFADDLVKRDNNSASDAFAVRRPTVP